MDQVFRPYNMDVQKYALFWKEPCQISESLVLHLTTVPCVLLLLRYVVPEACNSLAFWSPLKRFHFPVWRRPSVNGILHSGGIFK